jgi:hypothetical protein
MSAAIVIIFGAAFVLGRIRTDEAKLEAAGAGLKGALGTTSPGLFLVFVGGGLLAMVLSTQQELTTSDGASFGQFLISDTGANAAVGIVPIRRQAPASNTPTLSDEEIRKRLQSNPDAAGE